MSKAKVLIVDDAKLNRRMLAAIFAADYDVCEAEDGQEAMSYLECDKEIELVLLDLVMPKKNGFEVLDYMSENGLLSMVPVILVTESSEPEYEISALRKGAAELVRKPYVPEIILKRAENLLTLYQSRRLLQKRLDRSEKFDSVTNFLNRSAFYAEADKLLKQIPEEERCEYTLVYTNIRNFRYYNIRHSIGCGDNALRALATMICSLTDGVIRSRFASDHFVVLARAGKEGVEAKTELLQKAFFYEYGEYSMKFCAGSYTLKSTDTSIEQACEYAKLACDSIRSSDRNYCCYDDEFARQLEIRAHVLQHIDDALKNRYIKVYYQPIVHSLTGKTCGMEALARWDDPELGLLQPIDFVPTLEENRLITKLDLYMLREICRELKLRCESGHMNIPVSFNLSHYDFEACDIFSEVERIVCESGVTRDLLNIEVTESAISENSDLFKMEFDRFRKAGYQVWMDDFGSGFSSLNVLKDFNFDEIKLDMKFTSSMDERSKQIVTSIVDMAKRIGIQTLAEGVETKENYDFLRGIGCEKLQGYYICKPISGDELNMHEVVREEKLEHHSRRDYCIAQSSVNFITEQPLALVEWDGRRFEYLYINEKYESILRETGIKDLNQMSDIINLNSSSVSRLLRDFTEKCHVGGGEKTLSYAVGDHYLRIAVTCVAEHENFATYRVNISNMTGRAAVQCG